MTRIQKRTIGEVTRWRRQPTYLWVGVCLAAFFSAGGVRVANAAEACPNEALRGGLSSSLPDCRAYEQVSPAPTSGESGSISTRWYGDSSGVFAFDPIVAAGDNVLFSGVSPALPGNAAIQSYESSRGSNGWTTHNISPGGTSGLGSFSSDHDYSLFTRFEGAWNVNREWVQVGIGGPAGSSVIRNPEGSFEQLGHGSLGNDPYAEGRLITPGATHVIFTSTPNDAEQRVSVPSNTIGGTFTLSLDGVDTTPSIPYNASNNEVREALEALSAVGAGNVSVEGDPKKYSPNGWRIHFTGGLAHQPVSLLDGDASNLTVSGGEKAIAIDLINSGVGHLEPNTPTATGVTAIYDRTPGGLQVASLLPNDVVPSSTAEYLGSSQNGTAVAFEVGGTMYVRRDDSVTLEVTGGEATFAGVSQNGVDVFYAKADDIYSFDTNTDATTQITETGDSKAVNISADGSHVYFASKQQIGGKGTAGENNLYVWDRMSTVTAFIATVTEGDMSGEANVGLAQWPKVVGPRAEVYLDPARTTPDGRVFVFESTAKLTAYENGGKAEIYRWDMSDEPLLTCVSCNPSGEPAVSDARLQNDPRQNPTVLAPPNLTHNLSDNGARVFFQTSDALVPGDVDNAQDVYEWEADGAGGCSHPVGCIALISSGQSPSAHQPFNGPEIPTNFFYGATPDGGDVLFITRDALLPGADSGDEALYDARVGGGFPQSSSAPCSGEACQGPPSAPPTMAAAASATFVGNGNLKVHRHRHMHRKHRHHHRRAFRGGRGAVSASAGRLTRQSIGMTPGKPVETAGLRQTNTPPAEPSAITSALTEGIKYGIESVAASETSSQAGDHPDFTTTIVLNHQTEAEKFGRSGEIANDYAKDIYIESPAGLLGDPNNVAQCTGVDFTGFNCPLDSQIGQVALHVEAFETGLFRTPIYMLKPPNRNVVARFGFVALVIPITVELSVRSSGDYGITAATVNAPQSFGLISAEATLWGVPADPVHDTNRQLEFESVFCQGSGHPCFAPGEERPSGLPKAPFLSNPTSCGPLQVGFVTDSWEAPGVFSTASASLPGTTGCEKVSFNPTLSVTPTSHEAGAATGLDAKLRIPQNEAFDGLATSQLKDTTVTLPEGMTVNSASADGLQGCSAAEVGFQTENPSHCPDGSKLGTATFISPDLVEPLQGAIYLRTPEPGHLFRFWLVADDLGVHLKLPAEVSLDQATGRLTTTILESPQLPAEEVELHIKGGSRAPLKNPESCGTFQTRYEFAPWSGNPQAVGSTPMTIDEGCDTGGFGPHLSAGTVNPVAGSFSPVVTTLTRESGEEALSGLEIGMPPGVLAKIAGVPLCSDTQAATGDCPASSQVGTTTVATGAGPTPLWIPQSGKSPTAVYLAGPYKSGPYSLVVKTPAQAGPFDLGNVIVRAPIQVDPETTKVTVKSDPLPQILEGVPISYRTVHVDVNRPEFTLNPTSCEPMAVTGTATSNTGQTASLSDRFQVGSCASLGFKPKLSMRLSGKTHRGAFPAFHAVLKMPKGGANIARASVRLPHSEFLANAHIRTICTRVQFAEENCPRKSIYGHATAKTPLLDQPLSGPVYLRSSSHELPDLVADLHGQIHVVLDGRIDSVHGGIRSVFEAVPDAPVSQFTLDMQGGAKGLLDNSTGLCRAPHLAVTSFTAQNGRLQNARVPLESECGKGGKGR